MSALLALKDLSFAWPEKSPLFSGLDLEIYPNDIIGITGPNGCGKSTLLSCIAGLLPLAGGQIFLEEKKITSRADFQLLRKRIGYCLQNAADQIIFPNVLDDVAFGPANLGFSDPQATAREIMAALNIEHLANEDPAHLSGGQLRMVALAGILAMHPLALLLDEPLTGLDQQASARVIELLQRLPCAKLIVYHEKASLDTLCERHYIFHDGLLEEC